MADLQTDFLVSMAVVIAVAAWVIFLSIKPINTETEELKV